MLRKTDRIKVVVEPLDLGFNDVAAEMLRKTSPDRLVL